MYAVKELSRGLSAPTSEHEAKVKHLLKYLAGTKNFEQKLQPTLSLSPQHRAIDINIYVDSDWAGCHDSANILSHSRTQATVALSSGEAELYAIGSGTADAPFVRSLVEESKLFQTFRRLTFVSLRIATLGRVLLRVLLHALALVVRPSMWSFGTFTFKNLLLQAWFGFGRCLVL